MTHIRRHLEEKVIRSLSIHPAVFLNGPRQAGKTTLATKLAKEKFPAQYISFDKIAHAAAATHTPEDFLRNREGALIIDEVQMVPEIFRPLKIIIDELRLKSNDRITGKFLLTSSTNIMTLPKLSDALVGRMGIQTLYPLSGSEILEGQSNFIERLFQQDFTPKTSEHTAEYIIQHATFPEANQTPRSDCSEWYDHYTDTLLRRDVLALGEVDKLSTIPLLLQSLATRVGGLINDAEISRITGLNHITAKKYRTLLNMVFLTMDVPAWHRNIGKRLVKSPKCYFIDTALLCHTLQYDIEDLATHRPEIYGFMIENLVASELTKLLSLHHDRTRLFHFRTSDNKEVDFVLEQANGKLCGIEVKKREQIKESDFNGLRTLQALTGQDFVTGVILYSGQDVIPFGQNLWAIPISNLWH